MMKNRFDAFVLTAVLAALFCIGIHIGKGGNTSDALTCTLTLSVTELRGTPSVGDKLFIDSKIESTVTECSDTSLTLSLCGWVREAGFLAGGAKYISLNQPIKLSNQSVYAVGRVRRMVY